MYLHSRVLRNGMNMTNLVVTFEISYIADNQDQVIRMVRKYLQERYDKQDIETSFNGMCVKDKRYCVIIKALFY